MFIKYANRIVVVSLTFTGNKYLSLSLIRIRDWHPRSALRVYHPMASSKSCEIFLFSWWRCLGLTVPRASLFRSCSSGSVSRVARDVKKDFFALIVDYLPSASLFRSRSSGSVSRVARDVKKELAGRLSIDWATTWAADHNALSTNNKLGGHVSGFERYFHV